MNTIKHEQDKKMKVAIIHYWLNGMRGGEKVLENICSLYPENYQFNTPKHKNSILLIGSLYVHI